MGHAKGEAKQPSLRPTFDRGIKVEFHGARIASDGGLLAYRELDDLLGLAKIAITKLLDGRRGRNTRLAGQLWSSEAFEELPHRGRPTQHRRSGAAIWEMSV